MGTSEYASVTLFLSLSPCIDVSFLIYFHKLRKKITIKILVLIDSLFLLHFLVEMDAHSQKSSHPCSGFRKRWSRETILTSTITRVRIYDLLFESLLKF